MCHTEMYKKAWSQLNTNWLQECRSDPIRLPLARTSPRGIKCSCNVWIQNNRLLLHTSSWTATISRDGTIWRQGGALLPISLGCFFGKCCYFQIFSCSWIGVGRWRIRRIWRDERHNWSYRDLVIMIVRKSSGLQWSFQQKYLKQ